MKINKFRGECHIEVPRADFAPTDFQNILEGALALGKQFQKSVVVIEGEGRASLALQGADETILPISIRFPSGGYDVSLGVARQPTEIELIVFG